MNSCGVLIISIFILISSSLSLSGQIVDGGNGHALILDKKGHVWTIGRNDHGQLGDGTLVNSPTPKIVKNLNNIISICFGIYFRAIFFNDIGIFNF